MLEAKPFLRRRILSLEPTRTSEFWASATKYNLWRDLDYFAVNPLTVGDIGRTAMWGFIFVWWLNDGEDRAHPIVMNYITVTPMLTGHPSLICGSW